MSSDLAEMRKQLRELRKEHVKPVSRMRKGDIVSELERLKKSREETPAPAAVPSAKPRRMEAAASEVKEAKRKEFPAKPAAAAAPKKKSKGSKAALLKMLAEMSSSDEE